MKVRNTVILILIITLFCAVPLLAQQGVNKVGTSGAQFLKLGVGAKYAALGDAAVANVNDGYALYWNPAAMGALKKSYLEFTNIKWVEDVNLNYFAYAKPTDYGSFGVAITAMSSGDIEITTVDNPNGSGDFYSATSYAISLGYARQMTDFFSVGFNAKYVTEKISEETASGIAFDFGTILYTGYRNLRVGMNISNLGPEMEFSGPELNFNFNPSPGNDSYDNAEGAYTVSSYDLPLLFRIGAAYDFAYSENSRLTMSVSATDPSDNEQHGSIGAEAAFHETFFLRGGWKINTEEESVSLGGGLNLKVWEATDLTVNYAWADFGRLSTVHRFSFGFRF